MSIVTRMADRLLELVVPHTVARANDCGYECCKFPAFTAKYCCYHPNGTRTCGSCQSYIYCS